MLRVVPNEAGREDLALTIDQIVAEGARRMLAVAPEVEVDACIEAASEDYARLHRRLRNDSESINNDVASRLFLRRASARDGAA